MAFKYLTYEKRNWRKSDISVAGDENEKRKSINVIIGKCETDAGAKPIEEEIFKDLIENNNNYEMSANVMEVPMVTVKFNGMLIPHNKGFNREATKLEALISKFTDLELENVASILKKAKDNGWDDVDAQLYRYKFQKENHLEKPYSFEFLYEVVVTRVEKKKAAEAEALRKKRVEQLLKPTEDDIGKLVAINYENIVESIALYDKQLINFEELKDRCGNSIDKTTLNKIRTEVVRLTWERMYVNVRTNE